MNRAIVAGHRSGVVSSATVMANARAYDDAVALAKAAPGLKTGCHVVLIDGEPVTEDLPTLTQGTPHFRSSLKQFAVDAVRGRIAAEEIQREAEAQIRRIQRAGLTLTHVDSHKHTHMFPHVLRPVMRAARACGIRAIRNPFEPMRSWPRGMVLGTPALWLRSAGVMTFQVFASEFRRALKEEGMVSCDGTVGIAVTGKLDQEMLSRILKALPEGTWELVCHPGYSDDDLRAAGTRLTQSREIELASLISAETKELFVRQKIELISYAEL